MHIDFFQKKTSRANEAFYDNVDYIYYCCCSSAGASCLGSSAGVSSLASSVGVSSLTSSLAASATAAHAAASAAGAGVASSGSSGAFFFFLTLLFSTMNFLNTSSLVAL